MKTVGILIVTHNRLKLLKEEIESIKRQTYQDYDIIIVNNGSNDGTTEWLHTQNDIISINQENIGGAGGFYTGLKYITEQKYEFCWLMDDDVECSPTSLEILIRTFKLKPTSGFICSRVRSINGLPMNMPQIDDRKVNGLYPMWLNYIDDEIIKVRNCTFVSVLIPTKVCTEIGLPIKEFFIWGDDTEYTERISSKYPCFLAFKSIVTHKRQIQKALDIITETDPHRINMHYYALRNNYLNTKKYGKKKDIIIYHAYILSLFFKCISKLDFKRLKIILKVYIAMFTFSPSISYPNDK